MKRIHVVDAEATEIDASAEVVVRIGPAVGTLRARGLPVVAADTPLAAALYVRGAHPTLVRVSVADPLGFFALLVGQDGAHSRLVA